MYTKMVMVCLALALFAGCSPKVGSPEWCKKMEDKPNGDWTVSEVKDYANHCLFK